MRFNVLATCDIAPTCKSAPIDAACRIKSPAAPAPAYRVIFRAHPTQAIILPARNSNDPCNADGNYHCSQRCPYLLCTPQGKIVTMDSPQETKPVATTTNSEATCLSYVNSQLPCTACRTDKEDRRRLRSHTTFLSRLLVSCCARTELTSQDAALRCKHGKREVMESDMNGRSCSSMGVEGGAPHGVVTMKRRRRVG